ncbi:MAG: excisionase family DNA-binding protein [Actinomycetota bacterium]|nr:excisionase family DNA-binding protein [Actinomycetota bacterium]
MVTATSVRRLVSLHTAAERYEVSVRTLRRRIADGTLTAWRVGPRLVRVDADELESVLRRIPTASSSGGPDVAA